MKIKFIFVTLIIFLVFLRSDAYCQKNNIDNSQNSQHTSEQQFKEIRKQIKSLLHSVQQNKIELEETTKKLSAAYRTESISINKQLADTKAKTAKIADQIVSNTDSIKSIRKSAITTDWTQRGMFWSSMVLVIITIMATYLNYRIFRTQTDPDVIVYSTPDPKRSTLINLVIENLGKGVAKDITFSSNKPIPCRAFGMTDQAPQPPTMNTGPFIVGIPELGPGSKRVITWGQYHGLLKGLGDEILEITTEYSSRKTFFKKPKFQSAFALDMKSFEGTDSSGKDWEKISAESLQNVAKSLETLVTSLKNEANNNG